MDTKEFLTKIGVAVREKRKAKKLSLEAVAHDNDIAYGTLSKLELGKINNITISTLNSLINYLKIDLTLLLLDDESLSEKKKQAIQNIINLDDSEFKNLENLKNNLDKIFSAKVKKS
ncbi:MAG: transcriptional regulator with XRE-family HTH domain [Rickettsiales bacterium]|jgi:transcriptional regulator with XRE-family HTH domain